MIATDLPAICLAAYSPENARLLGDHWQITRKVVAKPCGCFRVGGRTGICGRPASSKIFEAGIDRARVEVPDHAIDLGVDEFLGDDRALLRIGLVILGNQFGLTLAPPIFQALAFSSSMAMRAPFSLSLPKMAWTVSGATWPILTTNSGSAGGALRRASCGRGGFGFLFLAAADQGEGRSDAGGVRITGEYARTP